MNKVLLAISSGLFLLILAGCSTTYVDQPSAQVKMVAQAKIDPILSIGPEIQGVATVERTLFLFVSGPGKFAEGVTYGSIVGDADITDTSDTIRLARAAAAYRACAENKADLIVYPRYVVMVDDYFFYKVVRAKVMGYKGVLKDIKVVDQQQEINNQKEMVEYLKEIKSSLSSLQRQEPQDTEKINSTLQDINSYLKNINNRDEKVYTEKVKKEQENERNLPTNSANIVPLKF